MKLSLLIVISSVALEEKITLMILSLETREHKEKVYKMEMWDWRG